MLAHDWQIGAHLPTCPNKCAACRYQEYMLDYDAACAGVALGHQVAKAEAARLAAEQLRQAEVLPNVILAQAKACSLSFTNAHSACCLAVA